jgi:hypothetical protein
VGPFNRPRRVDDVDPIPQQRQQPANGRDNRRRGSRGKPGPAAPGGKAPGHEPVFDQHADQKPCQPRHTEAQQEGEQARALVLGAGGGESAGEILIGLRVENSIFAPGPDGERLARAIGGGGHDSAPLEGGTGACHPTNPAADDPKMPAPRDTLQYIGLDAVDSPR